MRYINGHTDIDIDIASQPVALSIDSSMYRHSYQKRGFKKEFLELRNCLLPFPVNRRPSLALGLSKNHAYF